MSTLAPGSPSPLIPNILVAQLFGVLGPISVTSEAPKTNHFQSLPIRLFIIPICKDLYLMGHVHLHGFQARHLKNIPSPASRNVGLNLKRAERSLRYKHYNPEATLMKGNPFRPKKQLCTKMGRSQVCFC